MQTPTRTQVLIVGAGPTGLSLACQLVRYGIDFVIIEKNNATTPYSKAIGVQARTLEIYEQLELAKAAVEQGTITGKVRLLAGGEVRAELNLSNIGEGLSEYPYLLLLEQSKNEQLLHSYLQSQGREVLWSHTLDRIDQDDSGVTATVKNAGDVSSMIKADFLVGCDGAKSLTRHALGLKFEGSTFERMFYVADAQVDWNFSHDALHACLSKDTLLALFPLKGDKRYRIVGSFPDGLEKDEGDILYEEIERQIRHDAELELDIHDVEWFSTYRVHTRHVNKFSEGRCFLAGDSAHIHTPAGGQGMNTGIQDGYNLAWKLALVLRGKSDVKLLETYNEERLENAKNLLRTTDRIFQFAAGSDWLLAFLRQNVLPSVANFVLGFESVKEFVFPLISQIGINYRHGSLSQHAGDEYFKVKAGDRMPYFIIDGESVYDRLRQPKFHLIEFTGVDGEVPLVEAAGDEAESNQAEYVDFHSLTLSPQVAEIFGTEKPFSLLLRPDNYICYISTEPAKDRLELYLKTFNGQG